MYIMVLHADKHIGLYTCLAPLCFSTAHTPKKEFNYTHIGEKIFSFSTWKFWFSRKLRQHSKMPLLWATYIVYSNLKTWLDTLVHIYSVTVEQFVQAGPSEAIQFPVIITLLKWSVVNYTASISNKNSNTWGTAFPSRFPATKGV